MRQEIREVLNANKAQTEASPTLGTCVNLLHYHFLGHKKELNNGDQKLIKEKITAGRVCVCVCVCVCFAFYISSLTLSFFSFSQDVIVFTASP